MIYTATWIPPGLCGCEFRITADWTEPNDGTIRYRHPIPHTITDIQITSICATHIPQSKVMMDTSVFFDTPALNPIQQFLQNKNAVALKPKQNRGYLTYPIANPTPAQMLYSFFSMHAGQKEHLPCGCARYGFSDETNYAQIMQGVDSRAARNKTYVHHPSHTHHCRHHPVDGPDCAQAVADNDAFLATQAAG